ncbi:DsbA family protein [Comamonas flocculans]|uniref:Disulfide bond formation protein DsbA n=1 Tax=Comamonas flocculans TaxID=2597701 RepID=A0A5B8RS51_9BURK|nr:thioredoxin domain-containing protein [Comamonas flocculans]MBZ0134453.1 DsbA family protein [Rhodanobacter sp.]QEA12311.1 disulfide bond formation protein DsbA [Comamonas flocculans]
MTRRTTVILTALVALVAFAAAVFLYQRHERQQMTEQAAAQFDVMVREHSPVLGPVTAPVTIVEFFDPACEACRAFYPYVKQILAAYPKDVRLVIRYVPFHREPSIAGVQILEAARQQQRFEPIMDALMESQPVWASHSTPATERAWEFARAAGLDLKQARAYVDTGAVDKLLEQDVADLKAVGVRATPTFFVNGKPLPEPDPRVLLDMVKSEAERIRQAR